MRNEWGYGGEAELNSSGIPREEPRAARKRLSDLVDGYRSTALIYAAASLGIADALANGPMESGTLATMLGTDGDGLYRILRGLAAIGVLEEDEGGSFGLTAQGEFFATGRAGFPAYECAETVWALTSAEVFRLCTADRGWSVEEYAEWLAVSLEALLFG